MNLPLSVENKKKIHGEFHRNGPYGKTTTNYTIICWYVMYMHCLQSPRKEEEPKFKFTKFPVRNQEAKSTEEPCTAPSHVKWQRYVLWMQKKNEILKNHRVCLLHRHDQIKLHFNCCLLPSVLAPVLSLVSVCVSCKRQSSFYMFSSRVFWGVEGRPRSCGLWNQYNVLARIK